MKRFLVSLLALVLLLGGCSVRENGTGGAPAVKSVASALDTATAQLVLYVPDTEGAQLLRIVKNMVVPDGQLPLQAALVALLSDRDADHAPIFGGDGKLSAFIRTRDVLICDVKLPVAVEELSERMLMQSAVALLETARANSNVEYLYLRINGRALSPRGALENPMSTANLSLEQLWITHQYYMNRGETLSTQDRALLFYTDSIGEQILGCVTEDIPRDGSQIRGLVQRLSAKPAQSDDLSSVIPDGMTLSARPALEMDESGLQAVTLSFSYPDSDALPARALENLCRGLTLSICLNLTGVDEVKILINGTPVNEIPDTAITGLRSLNAAQFLGQVGDMLTLYFPGAEGDVLYPVRRAVSQDQAANLRAGIDQLLRGPLPGEDERLASPFPAGLTSEDLLSVESQGDWVILHFSQEFQDAYPADARQERLMIYAMVNTLTTDRIRRVQVQVESKRVGVLGTLDLSNPLIRNPGIIAQ